MESSPLLFIIMFGAVFFLFVIRPQMKQKKEYKAMLNALKSGDKVITSAGIHATIVSIKDTTVEVKIAENTKITLNKEAIIQLAK